MLASPPLSPPTDLIYTVPVGKFAFVARIIAVNTAQASPPAAATLTLCIGDSIAPENAILWEFSINANEVENLEVNIPMEAGEEIRAIQGTSGAITLTISGSELAL